jgi:hypothetical protein
MSLLFGSAPSLIVSEQIEDAESEHEYVTLGQAQWDALAYGLDSTREIDTPLGVHLSSTSSARAQPGASLSEIRSIVSWAKLDRNVC